MAAAALVLAAAAVGPARAGPGTAVALAPWIGPTGASPGRPEGARADTLMRRRLAFEPGVRQQLRLVFAASQGDAPPRLLVRVGESSHRVLGRPDGRWASVTVPVVAEDTAAALVDVEVTSLDGPVLVAEPALEPLGEFGSVPVMVAGLVWIGWLLNRRRSRPLLPSFVPR